MKLIVAGASHGVPEKHRFCTSLFLQAGENTYIIDAGAPISALLDHYDIPHKTVKGVFITHCHTDHINGLPEFCSEMMWWIGYQDCDPDFFYPDEKGMNAVVAWASQSFERRSSFKNHLYEEGMIFDDGVVKVTAIQNKHTDRSFSFYVEAEGKKLFFSGDLSYGFGEYLDLLGDKQYDLVVCEGAHHTPGTVNDLLAKTNTRQMIINHINLEREPALVKFCATAPFPCQMAEDGLTVEI
jgi:ribonuclease BN (tRNA processing enzyme)